MQRFTLNTSEEIISSGCFRCSAKEAVVLLLSWSTLHIKITKFIVSKFFFFFFLAFFTQKSICKSHFFLKLLGAIWKEQWYCFVLLWSATIYPSFLWKTHLFWTFWVLRERSSDIFSFVERPVYSIFKCIHLFFYKQLVYKKLALGWQMAKHYATIKTTD